MAEFKYGQFLESSQSVEFDKVYLPSTTTNISGVYRCEGCGKSVTSISGRIFPPQNHHQHSPNQGTIRWRLVVASHWRS